MRRIDIINMFRTLGKIRTAGITDKTVKSALISAHLKLFRHQKEHDDFVAGLRERFVDQNDETGANEAYGKYLKEEIEVTLEKIDREAFAKAIADTDTDIYLGELTLLEPIFKED